VLAGSGNYLFVSSFREDAGAEDAGAVYMFDANPGSPTFGNLLMTFDPPNPVAGSNFGFSLAASDKDLFVGAWMESTASQPAGGVPV